MIDVWLFILGVPVGIALSFASWYVMFHVVKGKVIFGSKISKQPCAHATSGHSYEVKVFNEGSRRIIDLEYFVRYRIKGIGDFREEWYRTDLATSASRSPILKGKSALLIQFSPENTPDFQNAFYGESIVRKVKEGTLELDDVLSLGEIAQLQICVFGYDGFSGSRCLHRSKWYSIDDMVETDPANVPLDRKTKTDR
jgi:hypothetical protein